MSKPSSRIQDSTTSIRSAIRGAERNLIRNHPWLAWNDCWGMTICLLSAGGMLALTWAFMQGLLPWWVCLLGNAFLASLLHEIEHDLIHYLYFKDRPWIANSLMFLVWAFRGNIIHGWSRRPIHFQHHRASGAREDLEERLLGLGLLWGWRRLLIMLDGAASYFLCAPVLEREIPDFRRSRLFWASFPFYPLFVLTPFSWVFLQGAQSLFPEATLTGWLVSFQPWIVGACVGWVLPNYLRQACLQIVSSNVHYYQDVQGIEQETQILRRAFLWPLQLFCFNFGATHCLHHYVASQPFYLRQLVAPRIYPALRQAGIRFNDLGTVWRANRFSRS